MQSTAFAQKKPVFGSHTAEYTFSESFYAPYRAAVETALLMLCDGRARLKSELGEETIRRMTFRLKTPSSISGKLRKRGLPVTRDAASAALHDIAGLRVVLSSEEAVYRYAKLIMNAPIAELTSCRDYIETPKASGYRSLHLLMTVPVTLGGRQYTVPVEIQLRTCDMDAWAAEEHDTIYKRRPQAESSPSSTPIPLPAN